MAVSTQRPEPGTHRRVRFETRAPCRKTEHRPLEGQEMRWVEAGQLNDFAMPPADVAVLAYLSGGISVPKI